MLHITGLTRRYPGMDHPAVDHLDLTATAGEVVALAGASGSGKTTSLRLVAGFDRPDAGTIEVSGATMAGRGEFVPPERRNVGVVFQDFALFPHLTVEKNVAFGMNGTSGGEQRRRVAELLEMAGIPELAGRYPHEISGGQQQRVALARALAPRPEIILLDEPFSNLDHTCTHRLLAETRELLKSSGCTAVVVTHDRYEAFTLADRIAVLEEGRLEQVGTAEEIYNSPRTRHVAEFAGQASFVPVWHGSEDRWISALGPVPEEVAVVPGRSGGHLAVARPHHLSVAWEDGDAPQTAPGAVATVTDIRFLGAVQAVQLAVRTPEGPQRGPLDLLVHIDGPPRGAGIGATTRVSWIDRGVAGGAASDADRRYSSVAR